MSQWYPPPGEPAAGGLQPPPGWSPPPPPGAPPPGYGPPGSPGYGAPLRAAHKPGAIPLRPLGLSDIYDAAFKIIRFNPKATVGSAVIVSSVAMLVPILVMAALSWTVGLSVSGLKAGPNQPTVSDLAGLVGAYGALALGSILAGLGMIMVTGMNAHVALAAATGRKLGLGEAWAATHGKRWRLVGLTALVALAATVLGAAFVGVVILLAVTASTATTVITSIVAGLLLACLMVWLWIRVSYLAVPPLMLEPVGVFGAFGRAFRLTRSQFWRTFGIAALTLVVTQIVGGILQTPITLVGQLLVVADPHGLGVLGFVVTSAVASVLASSVVSPFVSTVASLQYLDQRIRKEAFDLELMARAGIIAS